MTTRRVIHFLALVPALVATGCLSFTDGLPCRDSADCRDDYLCLSQRCEPRDGRHATLTVGSTSATVLSGATLQLVATVSGVPDAAVLWTLRESAGGTLSPTGLFAAGGAGTFHAVATARADAAVAAVVELTVPPVSVTVLPSSPAAEAGGRLQLSATVTGAFDSGVVWSLESGGGTVDQTGLYLAPATPGSFRVTATSRSDPDAAGTVSINVFATPAQLTFDQTLFNQSAASPLPDLRVRLQGVNGEPSTAPGAVTISLNNGPPGAQLNGPATAKLVGGVALFQGLSLTVPGEDYSLRAYAYGLAAYTNPFVVTCTEASPGPYRLGGTLRGLTADGLVLAAYGLADLPVPLGATTFSFKGTLPVGAAYSVEVRQQPAGLVCDVASGAGVISCGDALLVRLDCSSSRWAQVAAGEDSSAAVGLDGSLWVWGAGFGSTPHRLGAGFASVSVGSFGAAVKTDGTLWTWRPASLGDGTDKQRWTPAQVGSGFASVSVGSGFALAVKTDGALWAWGGNSKGVLGDGTTTSRLAPVKIGDGYVQASAGMSHSAAIKADGSLWTWGEDVRTIGSAAGGLTTPHLLGTGFTKVSAGAYQTLALTASGAVRGWGIVQTGQAPDGDLGLGQGLIEVSATYARGYAIRADHALVAWGENDGLLGNGGNGHSGPTVIAQGCTAVSAGSSHALALRGDGTIVAWGSRVSGRLGDGKRAESLAPRQVAAGVTAVSMADGYSLFLKAGGAAWSMGDNGSFQLGSGAAGRHAYSPVPIGVSFASVSAGQAFALALDAAGGLWGWGAGYTGVLGDSIFVVVPKKLGEGFASVSAGSWHALATKPDGTLWGWGDNEFSEVGDGATSNRSSPVQVGAGFSSVAAGYFASLALKADHSVWAWGRNEGAVLGSPFGVATVGLPAPVSGLTFASITTKWDSAAGIMDDHTLWFWGNGNPTPVQLASGVTAVSLGTNHVLALHAGGSLWSTGTNDWGQLGDGSRVNHPRDFVKVGEGFVSISAGYSTSAGIKADSTLWTWGRGSSGELGNGDAVQTTPVQVP